MSDLEVIKPEDLLPLDDFCDRHPVRVDVVYANENHKDNMFGCAIYRPEARMWGHRDFVPVILRAADICYARSGFVFELKDCLRTVEAQARMRDTDIVRANPQWLEEPGRLLSPPGKGGHPRGMAVDIILIDKNAGEVDMGTPFDFLTTDRGNNPAARSYKNFSSEVMENRQLLEDCMMQAAAEKNLPLLPLPQEWWDFRFMPEYSARYAPVHDRDLPPHMRMTEV